LGKDIVAGFDIVTDARIENGFAVDRLIPKTGAPGLEKVHTDGGAKDRALVRSKKISRERGESSVESSGMGSEVETAGVGVLAPIGTMPISSGRKEGGG